MADIEKGNGQCIAQPVRLFSLVENPLLLQVYDRKSVIQTIAAEQLKMKNQKRLNGPTIAQDRVLEPEELKRIFESIDKCKSHTVRDFIHLCLLTGADPDNVMAMEWAQIDVKNHTWNIPDLLEPYALPLVDKAIDILWRRRGLRFRSEYVLPADDPKQPMQFPKETWHRILQRAGITNIDISDLRRSLASLQFLEANRAPRAVGISNMENK